ncbi:hypothetical protein [Hyalangium minutum]|uniref:hypothetical protein n=1 Tax=Hyalangium minutum TaxID=394096 RepID=UPI0012F817E1|nr:hypothetical protein [Hyalangium minutum]
MLRSPLARFAGTWLLLGSLSASAQPKATEAKATEAKATEPGTQVPSWAYLFVATGPMERVEAAFAEMRMPLPQVLSREHLEEAFPFIGPGGIRPGGSVGMLMGAGDPGSTEPSGILLFPVTKDAAPLKGFSELGGRVLPDASDTVKIKGTYFRRTKGFLLTGPKGEYITDADPLGLEENLTGPGTLASVDVDLERWRKTDPTTFYPLLSDKEPTPGDEARHVYALGRSLGTRVYERLLNRVRLSVLDNGTSLRLRMGLEPLAPGEIAPLPRPSFPASIIGRLDIAYSTPESSQWLQSITEEFMNAAEKDGLFAEAEKAKLNVEQTRSLIKEVLETFCIADAISLAVEPVKGGKLVYHQVNQYRAAANFTARLSGLLEKIHELDRQGGGRGSSIGLTTYSAGGARISRLTFPGKKSLTVDFVDSGTTVRLVASGDTQRRVPGLLKLPASGTLTSGFSGSFDPSAAVDAYVASGGSMPLPLRTRVGVRGQQVTWTTRAEGAAAVVDLDIPKPLAQAIVQLVGSRAVDLEASDQP